MRADALVHELTTSVYQRTFYEFFAGGGMARAGLGPKWQCLFANDVCEKKAAAYKENWGSSDLVVGDVKAIGPTDLPGFATLAWASFPCQDLSLAGSYVGLSGNRSGTFWAFWDLIRQLSAQGRRPPIVVLENVYGALTSHGGKDFGAIARALASGGYRFGAMVVDGARFVPQSRPRLFVVAVAEALFVNDGLALDEPSSLWHPPAVRRAFSLLSSQLRKSWIWWNMPNPLAPVSKLADIIEEEPVGIAWHTARQTQELLEMMSPLNRKKVTDAQKEKRPIVGTIYRRTRNGMQRAEVRFDGISGCLRTPSGGSSRQTLITVNGRKVRSRLISPREAARLMGLPDSYRLPTSYNDAYMLAGDGLVVPAVSHLREHVIEPIVANLNRFHSVMAA